MSDKFCNFLITKHRAQSYGETWAEYREGYNKNNGIYALQEKISLLKNIVNRNIKKDRKIILFIKNMV